MQPFFSVKNKTLKAIKFLFLGITLVDNAYGDRHLVCSCQPIEAYLEAEGVS
jgi:hypothetical protein